MNKFEKEMYKGSVYMERHKMSTELYRLRKEILKELGFFKLLDWLNKFAIRMGL